MFENRRSLAKSIDPKDIVKREHKHATYCPSVVPGDYSDLHVVKELLTLKDGSKVPNLLMIKDYQVDFGVTKPAYRNHKEKKEYERIDRLKMYKTNATNLPVKVAQVLGVPGERSRLRIADLNESPYVYGTSIDSTTLIKHQYDIRWPDNRSSFTVGALDFESDVVNGTGDPIIGSYGAFGHLFLAIDRNWVKEFDDPERLIREYIDAELMDEFEPRGITQDHIHISFHDHPVKLIKRCTDDLHKLSPDLVSIFNIAFDVPLMLDTCKKYGARPEDILSDPAVPRNYRRAYFHEAPKEKRKVGKKPQPVDPIDRFHFFYLSAGWQAVCAQRIFKKVRPTDAKELSYSLDALAKKHLKGFGKFKPKGTEHLDGLPFHIHMQTKEKIAYCAYALIDPALCLWLDEAVNDLSIKFPLQCFYSSLNAFPSGPRKNDDEMYFGLRKKGYLQCGVKGDMTTEFCHLLPSSSNWITLLEPHLCHPEMGLPVNYEGDYETLVAIAAFDIDVKGAYPTTGVTNNIEKRTTRYEVFAFSHMDQLAQRQIGFQLSNSKVNAIELTKMVYQGPNLIQLRETLKRQGKITVKAEQQPGWNDYFDASAYTRDIYGA